MEMVKREVGELCANVFEKIGKGWMLVSAEAGGRVNTMTASWGGFGVLWGKNVAFVFIRPQRYTYQFVERSEYMTLSFFGEEARDALRYLGTHSGRDGDKISACGLHTEFIDGAPSFAEASALIVCKKLYADDIKKECFADTSLLSNYSGDDFHRMYVVEVESVYTK